MTTYRIHPIVLGTKVFDKGMMTYQHHYGQQYVIPIYAWYLEGGDQYRGWFNSSLMVGLAVHDSGTYREKFAPGMVITIEPGWYDKDAGYGIRIEDTYLITADGFDRLSAGAPREVDEIEKRMAKKKDF